MSNEPGPVVSIRVLPILFVLTLACAFTSGLGIEAGGLTVTLAYAVTICLMGYLVLYAVLTNRRVAVLYRDDISLLLYLFLASNILSSLVFSPDRFYSLKGCGPLLAGLLIYTACRTAIRVLVVSDEYSVRQLTALNLASAGLGLICMVAAMVTGQENFGVSFGHLAIGMQTLGGLVPPSIQSLSAEPNLFAIGTAVVLCLSIGRFLMDLDPGRKLIWIGVPVFAILFAYTRSVYGALVIVLVILLVLARQMKVVYRAALVVIVSVLVVTLVFIALPEGHPARQAITERVGTITDFEGGTGGGRWIGYQVAWKSYLNHPVLGNGTLSADTRAYNPYTGAFQDRMGSPGWLTGSVIQALHDTGVLGLLILLMLFGLLVSRNYNQFRWLPPGDPRRGWLLGFIGGNIVLFITSQLSSPLWTAFPYVFWAVNVEFLVHCSKSRLSPVDVPASPRA
jgi:O-Antigen ligase